VKARRIAEVLEEFAEAAAAPRLRALAFMPTLVEEGVGEEEPRVDQGVALAVDCATPGQGGRR
jgi:hypothetical protein